MLQNNPLLAQLKEKMQEDKVHLTGRVKGTEKSYGFLELDNREMIFIPPASMKKCLHGDFIEASILTSGDKKSAEPEKLIKYGFTELIGQVHFYNNNYFLCPDYNYFRQRRLKIDKSNQFQFKEGDWVKTSLKRHALEKGSGFLVEVTEIIAEASDPLIPWKVSASHENVDLNPCTLDIEEKPLPSDRLDLTHLPFLTIDGKSTQDMDDALYAKKSDDGYELWIAIADPDYYIEAGSQIDKYAHQRAGSIYLPNYTLPMLPREFSENLCSLKEGEIRPALCAKIMISHDGELKMDESEFVTALVKSQAKLDYDRVSEYFEHGEDLDNEEIEKVLSTLYLCSEKINKNRLENGIENLDRAEYRFDINQHYDVIAVHPVIRRTAQKMIEELMITANLYATDFLINHVKKGIFNEHAGFKADYLNDLAKLLTDSSSPIKENLGELDNYQQFRNWLNNEAYWDRLVRRFYAPATTTLEPKAHYGLGLNGYATWTSPIRKYGDLVNHRLIKSYLLNKNELDLDDSLLIPMNNLRKTYRRFERRVTTWLYCIFLKTKKNECFSGVIEDINRYSLNVKTDLHGAVITIPHNFQAKKMKDNQTWKYDVNSGYIYINGELTYKLGDKVEVQLCDVDLDKKELLGCFL